MVWTALGGKEYSPLTIQPWLSLCVLRWTAYGISAGPRHPFLKSPFISLWSFDFSPQRVVLLVAMEKIWLSNWCGTGLAPQRNVWIRADSSWSGSNLGDCALIAWDVRLIGSTMFAERVVPFVFRAVFHDDLFLVVCWLSEMENKYSELHD